MRKACPEKVEDRKGDAPARPSIAGLARRTGASISIKLRACVNLTK
jgi:hypothetical protein